MTSSQFGVAVLGATGFIGTPYRKEIRESSSDAQIVALCGRRTELLQSAGLEDSAELITTDWHEAVEHPRVNLVLVCTPDACHRDVVIECARLRKHVFCEKPIGLNVTEATEMKQAVESAGIAHYVPFWTRYVPVVRRARQLIHDGVAGEVKALVYRWHNPRPASMPLTWRDDAQLSSAGSVADVGSHAYDSIRWLLGSEAHQVLAHADVITPSKNILGDINLAEALEWGYRSANTATFPTRRGTAFDYASIAFELKNGVVGTLILSHASYIRKGLAPDIEIHGTEASLAIDRTKSIISIAKPGKDVEVYETIPDSGFGNRFSQWVFPALRERILKSQSEHPGMADGYLAQLFTDAASQSAREKRWIQL